jgi:hypothetical protein
MVYIGEIFTRKTPATSPSLLALATLGGAIQIGLFIFLVMKPKVAKASAVSCRFRWQQRHRYRVTFANVNTA